MEKGEVFIPVEQDYGIIFWGLLFLMFILMVVGIIDLLRKDFKDNTERTFWLIAIIITFGLGSIFYFVKRNKLIKVVE